MSPLTRYHQIRRVLWITLVVNLLVTAAKLVVGILAGSLAMIADGFHSLMDSASNVVGLVSSALAAQPPDEGHPYGHRRFETVASLVLGGFLLLTAWEIGKSSLSRLSSGTVPEVTFLSVGVMVATMVINLILATYERRKGKQLSSELLVADAENTRSDIFVSLAVLVSLVAARFGWAWADGLAALAVALLIVWAAWKVVAEAATVLVDRAALDADVVAQIVERAPGIKNVARVRSRGPEDAVYLDVDVRVAGPTTADQMAAIAGEVRSHLREQFSGLVDIQVHFLPSNETPGDYALLARAEADALGLGVHEVTAVTVEGRMTLEMHVEVPADQTVGEAHAVVTRLEDRLRSAVPDAQRIVTHIEPAGTHEHVSNPQDADAKRVARRALRIARRTLPAWAWHDLDIWTETDGGLALSMHCHVPGDMLLEDAHHRAEEIEAKLRAALPALHRVTIHTEPENA